MLEEVPLIVVMSEQRVLQRLFLFVLYEHLFAVPRSLNTPLAQGMLSKYGFAGTYGDHKKNDELIRFSVLQAFY